MNHRLVTGSKVNYYQHGQLVGTGKIVGSGIKNGQRVYDVALKNGETFWGYREQFNLVDTSQRRR